jgi:glycosyltransferase involved in cell wall biosynthesis
MKVMHIGLNPYIIKGGLTYYVQNLIREQLKANYDVISFYNGRTSRFYPFCHLRFHNSKTANNLIEIDLVNSPHKAQNQRGRPESEMYNRTINRIMEKALHKVKPDIVHIHELQGLSASVIPLFKSMGIKTVYTFHGYWPICSEVQLYDYTSANCKDFENGKRCVPCNWSPSSFYLKDSIASFLGSALPFFRKLKNSLLLPHDLHKDALMPEDFQRISNLYRVRRQTFVDALDSCDRLVAISQRAKEIYTNYGVRHDLFKIVTNPLCVTDETQRGLFLLRDSKREIHETLNICYRGGILPFKGLHILTKALKSLNNPRINLSIWGDGELDYKEKIKNDLPNNVLFKGRYNPIELKSILKDVDIGIIPSLWEEPGILTGLEFLAAGIPVIASRIGWLPEHIVDGVNGFLFEPGQPEELASIIGKIAANPGILENLRKNIKGEIKSVHTLFEEMDEIYQELIK